MNAARIWDQHDCLSLRPRSDAVESTSLVSPSFSIMVAMLITALIYSAIAAAFPRAGCTYTFTRVPEYTGEARA
jgi:hypothetical protein